MGLKFSLLCDWNALIMTKNAFKERSDKYNHGNNISRKDIIFCLVKGKAKHIRENYALLLLFLHSSEPGVAWSRIPNLSVEQQKINENISRKEKVFVKMGSNYSRMRGRHWHWILFMETKFNNLLLHSFVQFDLKLSTCKIRFNHWNWCLFVWPKRERRYSFNHRKA